MLSLVQVNLVVKTKSKSGNTIMYNVNCTYLQLDIRDSAEREREKREREREREKRENYLNS